MPPSESAHRLRVGVWGTGSVGRAALHEILLLPEMELVAVRVYDPGKNGQDVGEILSLAPVGIRATDDTATFIAQQPDCVIHAPRDFGDYRADEEIIRLLDAGINVVTVLPYHYLDMRDESARKRIEAAALTGEASLYATGINPGFMFERLALTLTGLCNDVRKISLTEVVNTEFMPGAGEFLTLFGFGMKGASPEAVEPVAAIVANHLTGYLYLVAEQMGRTIERIERDDKHVSSPVDIDVPGVLAIKAGTTGHVRFRWTAIADGEPFLSTEVNWYLTDVMRPDVAQGEGDDFWLIEIDGRPNARLKVELYDQPEDRSRGRRNPIHRALLATAIPAVQAVAGVIAAPPGVMRNAPPQFHSKADLRL